LANRYIEALCNNPSLLAPIFDKSIVPSSLLFKSSDFLADLVDTEGECFGQSKVELQEEALRSIKRLPEELLRMNVATEFGMRDFLDCLVDIEHSFQSFADATARGFACIDDHLDIRGFWYEMLVRQASRINYPEPIYTTPQYPGRPPVIVVPATPEPPLPIGPEPIAQQCYDQCILQCQEEPTRVID
jgi:hypothetical protein